MTPGNLYVTTQSFYLYSSDKINPFLETSDIVVPQESNVVFVKPGRVRFVKIIYGDKIGFLWLNTNKPTHSFFEKARSNEAL